MSALRVKDETPLPLPATVPVKTIDAWQFDVTLKSPLNVSVTGTAGGEPGAALSWAAHVDVVLPP